AFVGFVVVGNRLWRRLLRQCGKFDPFHGGNFMSGATQCDLAAYPRNKDYQLQHSPANAVDYPIAAHGRASALSSSRQADKIAAFNSASWSIWPTSLARRSKPKA